MVILADPKLEEGAAQAAASTLTGLIAATSEHTNTKTGKSSALRADKDASFLIILFPYFYMNNRLWLHNELGIRKMSTKLGCIYSPIAQKTPPPLYAYGGVMFL
jgi:hypothetical protein